MTQLAEVQKPYQPGPRILTLSPEEDRLLNALLRTLPRPPDPGYSKQQLLDALVGISSPEPFRESEWQRIYRLIQKTQRITEARVPGMPIVANTGRTARDSRYQLIGFTGHDGSPQIFQGAIQLAHATGR